MQYQHNIIVVGELNGLKCILFRLFQIFLKWSEPRVILNVLGMHIHFTCLLIADCVVSRAKASPLQLKC